MKTASFFTYTGAGRVSIARFPPRGTPAGFRVYKALAPGPWFNSVSHEEYDVLFAAQLAALVPAQVAADLENISGDHEPVLLCWERPPFSESNFCHRRIVARWLLETMGMKVREVVSRKLLEASVVAQLSSREVARLDDGAPVCKSTPLSEMTEAELIAELPRDVAESLGLQ